MGRHRFSGDHAAVCRGFPPFPGGGSRSTCGGREPPGSTQGGAGIRWGPKKGIRTARGFAPPPLAQLSAADQVFVAAFVRSHGSIKQMEKLFGVSYPTIKNRLNEIGAKLEFVAVEAAPPIEDDTLDRLERGELSAAEAIELIKRRQE